MKKGDLVTGTGIGLDFPNKAKVLLNPVEEASKNEAPEKSAGKDNCVVRTKGVLPGQKVKLRIKKMHHGSPEGILLEVLEKNPLETESDCPHSGICGGCSYRTLPYEEQLKLKENQVKDLLRPVLEAGGVSLEEICEGIYGSPVLNGYRNKMEFSFGDEYKDGPLSLGLHKKGSMYDIVPVFDCQIVDEDFRKILKFTLEYFKERNIPYFHKTQHTGYLRHLLVRKSRKYGEILVALVTTSEMDQGVGVRGPFSESVTKENGSSSFSEINREANRQDILLAGFAMGLQNLSLSGTLTGIVHTVNDSVADIVKDEGSEVLFGRAYIREELLGLQFRISQFSFFQTNSLGAEVLYGKVRDFLLNAEKGNVEKGENEEKHTGVIYDLYSGTGTIAQLLAPVADKAVGVEIVEEAVEAAKENAKLNGLDNCEFIAGDVLKVLDDLTDKPDMIILDPPRDGIHPKALPKILSYGVEHMVYVSCKPTSLARDLEVFISNGYLPTELCMVDMFPGTVHVETVALLSKLTEAKHHVEVKVDMDELDLTSVEAKATYREIVEWVREKYGFHVTNLNIAQVKQKHGIIERENYNKPKSPDSRQPGCPEEKVKAIEDAMRHFQMI